MKVKKGASIDGCSAEILRAAIAIESCFLSRDVDMVITSGSEHFKHSALHSAHYRGDAIDVRSKTLGTTERKNAVLRAIKRKLGPNYIVILESLGKPWEHYHVHWAPVFGA